MQWRQVEAAVLESAGSSAHARQGLADLGDVLLVGKMILEVDVELLAGDSAVVVEEPLCKGLVLALDALILQASNAYVQ